MKHLLTEWRKFLLLERDTDLMYQEIISFLTENILPNWEQYYSVITFDDPNFRFLFPNSLKTQIWAKKKKDRQDIEYKMSNTWEENALLGLSLRQSEIDNIFNNFKQFQQQYRQNNPLSAGSENKEIIKNRDDFRKLFSKVRIVFFASKERPEAAGDMAPNGIMRIFIPADKNFINILRMPPPDLPNMFKDWVSQSLNTETMRRIISHEFAHFLNAYRANFKTHRTAGSGERTKDQYDIHADQSHWYANSTEEIQARMTEITGEIVRRFKSNDPKILDLFKNKDFSSFKNDLLNLQRETGGTFRNELFYDKLSGKTKDSKKEPPALPPIPGLPPLPQIPGLPPVPPLPPHIMAMNKKDLERKNKLTPKKKEEIKRKVDNRLLDLYNALKSKIS